MKHKKRKTAEPVDFVIERRKVGGGFLCKTTESNDRWGSLWKALRWNNKMDLRSDAIGMDLNEAYYHIRMVALKNGKPKELIGDPIDLFPLRDRKPLLEKEIDYKEMLIEVLAYIEEHGLDTERWEDSEVELLEWLEEVSPRAHRFWKEHIVDSEEHMKQVRQEALLKLSDEEKRALGLRDEADNEPEEL
jgi:hypothetical protein